MSEMATYQAIAAIGSAIVGVLKAARPAHDFESSQFMLNQPGDLQNTPPMEEGLSLYLYRVAFNTTRRNWPARIGPDGQRFRPSLTLEDIVNIWDAFKPNLQISVAYVARMVLIDSTVTLPDSAPVQTRVFDFGKEAVS